MDRGLFAIRKIDSVSNAWVRELCEVMKGMDESICQLNEWGIIIKEDCMENRLVSRPQKR